MFLSCEFDQGLGPSKTKIAGKVIFLDTASRPDNVDEVRVIAVSALPPSGFGDVYFSNAVRFDVDTAAYELSAPFGSYPAVGVVWKARGKNWSLTNLMGIYGFKPPFEFALQSVQVTKERPVADNVDVFALWTFTQFDATIEGKITFAGNWPEDTETILLGAFVEVPDLKNMATSLGLLGGLPLPITSAGKERDYEIAVRNGAYKFIGVFWKGKKIDWKDIRCIGFYPDPANSSRPGAVQIAPAGTVSGINLVVDFSTLPEGVKLGGTHGFSGLSRMSFWRLRP
ncbi:MAG: hypothetical protein ONB44_23375 [candidate division KSB1 bacterium]|nr:hypothetical protein [candidate division KSB1 bacterium]MDZ7305083.1 hypothetical protein [candidate division KSB1 bacterium]MDZ7313400.1 hypothetical protein [candidate division KSB1 bacterium]